MRKLKEISNAYNDYRGKCNDNSNQWTAFRCGVSYADNNPIKVWHDISKEIPIEGKYLLVKLQVGLVTTASAENGKYYYQFGHWFDKEDIQIWAYIEDLIPQGGEK